MKNEDEFLQLFRAIKINRTHENCIELDESEMKSIMSLNEIYKEERCKNEVGKLSECTMKACIALKPLYNRYRSDEFKNKPMPEEIIRAVYFIIFFELTYREHYNNSKKGRRQDCIAPIFQELGENTSKRNPLKRMGIQPLEDFRKLTYKPIKFNVNVTRDEFFQTLLKSILYWTNCAMFIDLTGEDSILPYIAYNDKEVICCENGVTANFYNVLKHKYEEFYSKTIGTIDSLHIDKDDIIKKYQNDINEYNIVAFSHLEECRENKEPAILFDENYHVIQTYPLGYEYIDLEVAVKYFIIMCHKKYYRNDTEDFKKRAKDVLDLEIERLSKRVRNATISMENTKDILSKISNSNLMFLHLSDTEEGYELKPNLTNKVGKEEENCRYRFFENIDITIARRVEEIKAEADINNLTPKEVEKQVKTYLKNKERRSKKGFIFFDFTVNKNIEEAFEFVKFTKVNECHWLFVCQKDDVSWIEHLKGKRNLIISINEKCKFEYAMKMRGFKTDTVIITNIEIKGIHYENFPRLYLGHNIKNTEESLKELISIRETEKIKFIMENNDEG